MSFGATFVQRQVLGLLEAAYVAGEPTPSYREIAAKVGRRSTSSISRIMGRLEERGLVRRLPGQARAIELINPPSVLDEAVELALVVYCKQTERQRSAVVADALREYLRAHPAKTATKEDA